MGNTFHIKINGWIAESFLFFNLPERKTLIPLPCVPALFQSANKGRTQNNTSGKKAMQSRCNSYAEVNCFSFYNKQRKTKGNAATNVKRASKRSICSMNKIGFYSSLTDMLQLLSLFILQPLSQGCWLAESLCALARNSAWNTQLRCSQASVCSQFSIHCVSHPASQFWSLPLLTRRGAFSALTRKLIVGYTPNPSLIWICARNV